MARGINAKALAGLKTTPSTATNDTAEYGAPPFLLSKAFTGTSNTTLQSPCPLKVIDVWVVCTAAVGSGDITLLNGSTAVTVDAIACVTDKALTRAVKLDDAQQDFDRNETMTLDPASGGATGIIYILCVRREG